MLTSMAELTNIIKGVPAEVVVKETLQDDPISTVYLIDYQGIPSVLRLDKPITGYLGLDRSAEFHLLNCIQSYGFSPEPLYSDPREGILIYRFFEGEVLTPTDLGTEVRSLSWAKYSGRCIVYTCLILKHAL